MADNKKAAGGVAGAPDIMNLVPEGYENQVADAYQTGLLTALYLPKFAALKNEDGSAREGFPDVAGWFDRVHLMPEQTRTTGSSKRRDDDESWVPFNLLVRDLKQATKGVRRNEIGPLTNKSIVEVAQGDKILVPITGQITVNQDLQDALLDLDHVYWTIVRCAGFKKVNSLNAMADWQIFFLRDAKKNKIKRKRDGEYSLPDWYKHAVMNGDLVGSFQSGELIGSLAEGAEVLANGERADTRTGEISPGGVPAPAMS